MNLPLGAKGGKKKIGKTKYPDKTSINLLIQERNTVDDPKFQLIIFAVFIIVLLIFVKFMVVDKLIEGSNAKDAYSQLQSEISTLQSDNAEYDKINDEYSHYGNGYYNEEEQVEVDRAKALDVINNNVVRKSSVTSVDIGLNAANITIDNVTLNTVSAIVSQLELEDIVSYVSVSTAGTEEENSSLVTATMTINFKANEVTKKDTTSTDANVDSADGTGGEQ